MKGLLMLLCLFAADAASAATFSSWPTAGVLALGQSTGMAALALVRNG